MLLSKTINNYRIGQSSVFRYGLLQIELVKIFLPVVLKARLKKKNVALKTAKISFCHTDEDLKAHYERVLCFSKRYV